MNVVDDLITGCAGADAEQADADSCDRRSRRTDAAADVFVARRPETFEGEFIHQR